MDTLTTRERELVALGAALGSNCVPCIEHHVPEARRAGLTDRQIGEAIRLADKVRQVPARKVLDAALGLLVNDAAGAEPKSPGSPCAEPAGTAPAQVCCG
jgi:4-carboxymuconolactone decarboxylase